MYECVIPEQSMTTEKTLCLKTDEEWYTSQKRL